MSCSPNQVSERGCLEANIINMESAITMKYGWVDMLQIPVSFPQRTDDTDVWFKEWEATLAVLANES